MHPPYKLDIPDLLSVNTGAIESVSGTEWRTLSLAMPRLAGAFRIYLRSI
jgi:hypothetical protein